MSLRKIGPREQWTVQLTAAVPEAVPTTRTGIVAIDVGWRTMPEGLRVATWADDAGKSGSLVLSATEIGALRKAEELRRVRDQKFDVARVVLVAWLAARDVPEWLSFAARTLPQWRSPARLASLALRWADARFDGDEEAYDAIEAWRYKDRHLWEWETSQRTKSLRRRREGYRVFAAELARNYGVVVLERFDKRRVAPRPAVDEPASNETARSNRQLAAVSELCGVVKNATVREGGRIVEEDAIDTTHICHVCGVVGDFDAAMYVHHACEACGAIWDQDDNAAQNLLGRARERLRGEKEAGVARNTEKLKEVAAVAESRWVRARRMAVEKAARKEVARKTGTK